MVVLERRMRALTSREKRLLIYFAVFCGIVAWDGVRRHWSPEGALETEHYVIESSATTDQTREIGHVAEIVYEGYRELIAQLQHTTQPHPKLKMKLFKDREEFRRCNRFCGWAEAFYRRPYCYQYYSADEAKPHHWMMHEATHQLNAEAACLTLPQWLDEGLACYVSTGRIVGDSLRLGEIDTNTYPVWWLDSMELSGDLEADKKSLGIIPLRAILCGQGGPDLDKHVNLYYLHWWSLAHFLMRYENGMYRAGLARLIADGVTAEAFETCIGPVEEIEARWYNQLLDLRKRLAGQVTPRVRLRHGETSDSAKLTIEESKP